MLVLATAAQLSIPVGNAKVGSDKSLTKWTVPQHSVEERLQGESAKSKQISAEECKVHCDSKIDCKCKVHWCKGDHKQNVRSSAHKM